MKRYKIKRCKNIENIWKTNQKKEWKDKKKKNWSNTWKIKELCTGLKDNKIKGCKTKRGDR